MFKGSQKFFLIFSRNSSCLPLFIKYLKWSRQFTVIFRMFIVKTKTIDLFNYSSVYTIPNEPT